MTRSTYNLVFFQFYIWNINSGCFPSTLAMFKVLFSSDLSTSRSIYLHHSLTTTWQWHKATNCYLMEHKFHCRGTGKITSGGRTTSPMILWICSTLQRQPRTSSGHKACQSPGWGWRTCCSPWHLVLHSRPPTPTSTGWHSRLELQFIPQHGHRNDREFYDHGSGPP